MTMPRTRRDPKGYYAILGVTPEVDAATIKAAYRRRALDLHPDRNPRPEAHIAFARLAEAYDVLRDAEARARYDRKGLDNVARGRSPAWPGQPGFNSGVYTATGRPFEPPPGPDWSAASPVLAPFHKCQCGRVTAQPRFLEFLEVRSPGGRPNVIRHAGVFCPTCAGRTAIGASARTWAFGWWGLPAGPFLSVTALLRNIAGGIRPAEKNAALLIDQARAFLDRGRTDLARGVLEQARPFLTRPGERARFNDALRSIGDQSWRRLRNQWGGPRRATLVQTGPVLALALVVFAAADLSSSGHGEPADGPVVGRAGRPEGQTDTAEMGVAGDPEIPDPVVFDLPRDPDQVYHVITPRLAVREGPGVAFPVIAELRLHDMVQVTGIVRGDSWVRVDAEVPSGRDIRNGYVSFNFLSQGAPPPDPLGAPGVVPDAGRVPEVTAPRAVPGQ